MSERPEVSFDPLALAQRRRALMIDAVRIACFGGALASAAAALLGTPQLGISIAFGTLLGAINVVLLARGIGAALDRTVEEVERTRQQTGQAGPIEPESVVGRAHNTGNGFRLAFIVLLIAAALMFPPTQPMGLAIGVLIVLVATSTAAWREHQRTSQNAS
jgi:hypothetical protein